MSETYDVMKQLATTLNTVEAEFTKFLEAKNRDIREAIEKDSIYATPAGRRVLLQMYIDFISKTRKHRLSNFNNNYFHQR